MSIGQGSMYAALYGFANAECIERVFETVGCYDDFHKLVIRYYRRRGFKPRRRFKMCYTYHLTALNFQFGTFFCISGSSSRFVKPQSK
jgi:hypothetical protein